MMTMTSMITITTMMTIISMMTYSMESMAIFVETCRKPKHEKKHRKLKLSISGTSSIEVLRKRVICGQNK